MLPFMNEHSQSADQLQLIAAGFVAQLQPAQSATVVALSGDLGAGKTTFTQGIAKALGITETVSSPTFVIEKIYTLTDQQFDRLIHIDAYRIKGVREMEVLGWEEMLSDPKNLVIIEWPEKIAELIPDTAIRLKFDIENEGRIITSTYGS